MDKQHEYAKLLRWALDNWDPWNGGKLYATCSGCSWSKEYAHSDDCHYVAWQKKVEEILG